MSQSVISVDNLSKRYLIEHSPGSYGHKQYTALREVVGQQIGNLVRNALAAARGRRLLQPNDREEFWALEDVNFEIRQGDVFGIIGRNGAGKSTLLKILSRITEPTAGRVTLRGRVASLLEVGTGFHPELTGRENIYLNGAILGMSRAEIRRKFDEIIAFAEVERFLETPVKRYSSGMYMRLAFAVAAHLDAQILLIDEVLAVGDAAFQRKCLSKMNDVARENRTILFVSHNMGAIRTLTSKCILLDRGKMIEFGDTQAVINKYSSMSLTAKMTAARSHDLRLFRTYRPLDPHAEIIDIQISAGNAEISILPEIPFGTRLVLHIQLRVFRRMEAADLGMVVKNANGWIVTKLARSDYGAGLLLEPGNHTVTISVGDLPLSPGSYSVEAWVIPIVGADACDWIADYPLFSIIKEDYVDHYSSRIPWGAVHCRKVDWDVLSLGTVDAGD